MFYDKGHVKYMYNYIHNIVYNTCSIIIIINHSNERLDAKCIISIVITYMYK